jgi:hypothetical protein
VQDEVLTSLSKSTIRYELVFPDRFTADRVSATAIEVFKESGAFIRATCFSDNWILHDTEGDAIDQEVGDDLSQSAWLNVSHHQTYPLFELLRIRLRKIFPRNRKGLLIL